jgi:hypothetical protein
VTAGEVSRRWFGRFDWLQYDAELARRRNMEIKLMPAIKLRPRTPVNLAGMSRSRERGDIASFAGTAHHVEINAT